MVLALVPPRRVYHSMIYDSISDRIFLFGGQAIYHWEMDLRDVWAFSIPNRQWEYLGELEAGGIYALAYDDDHRRAIMLNLEGETWVYHIGPGIWEKRNPAKAPAARYGHRMIFEKHTGSIILFGGFSRQDIDQPPLNETWVYDYSNDQWTMMGSVTPSPPRSYHSMVYHPIAERTLVWGGRPYSERADTTPWLYESRSNSWEQLTPTISGPRNRYTYAPMVYCPQVNRIIMYGGLDLTGQFDGLLVDETWFLDLDAHEWLRAGPSASPAARSQHAMAFSQSAGKAIVMGGEIGGAYTGEFTNDLWLYDPVSNFWEEMLPAHP